MSHTEGLSGPSSDDRPFEETRRMQSIVFTGVDSRLFWGVVTLCLFLFCVVVFQAAVNRQEEVRPRLATIKEIDQHRALLVWEQDLRMESARKSDLIVRLMEQVRDRDRTLADMERRVKLLEESKLPE